MTFPIKVTTHRDADGNLTHRSMVTRNDPYTTCHPSRVLFGSLCSATRLPKPPECALQQPFGIVLGQMPRGKEQQVTVAVAIAELLDIRIYNLRPEHGGNLLRLEVEGFQDDLKLRSYSRAFRVMPHPALLGDALWYVNNDTESRQRLDSVVVDYGPKHNISIARARV